MNATLFVQLTHWQPNISKDICTDWQRTGRWYISMSKSDKVLLPIRNVVLEGRVFEVNSTGFEPVRIFMHTKVNQKMSIVTDGVVDYDGYDRLAESVYQKMINELLSRLRTSYDVNRTVITVS